MRASILALACTCIGATHAQDIYDIWQTTWNRSPTFERIPIKTGDLPVSFTPPGSAKSAVITVDDNTVYQTIHGFGGSLTDSAALTLHNMKNKNRANYEKLLNSMFNATDGANSAGLSYLRVPLGASDFSAKEYTFDDTKGDTSLNKFSIDAAPSYLFSIIKDIVGINPLMKVHLLPWSPPGWMKSSGHIGGGSLEPQYETAYAHYLLKSLQGFKDKGITAYAIGIQNEPQNSNPTYPTALVPSNVEAAIGKTLRTLMNANGFKDTKLIGFEHNWNDAGKYPVDLMNSAESAFDGVAFHCYAGNVGGQAQFRDKFPGKEIYLTECAGTIGTDWWTDIKWYMNNLWIGSLSQGSTTGLMWNIATNAKGEPKLPGTSSCGGPGCRALVSVNDDASYSFNQEFYSMAQASKAIIPKDKGGPWGRRVKVTVGGSQAHALTVGAYVTGRSSSSQPERHSLVVLNQLDGSNALWKPTPVTTTIEFRGKHATITFPVGVTTLWWFAPKSSSGGKVQEGWEVYGDASGGQQVPMGVWK
ncbi:glycoside hydrolase family 30 protein [Plicaturopsis crispa FD-325 SS-3]|uniref:Glycoside hydrolase family 30 protein n=1 Tax=Plicaturopsis crispa FD-325 SS-3 TaxID=944288 RepID=A0A0C9SKN2_PLICR|nr:glycoside hydrolase family 30 protein [Plicaturopsis crispa FD-325 SS-3]